MGRKIMKVAGWLFGAAVVAAIALFAFLMLDSGASKDHLLQKKASADGKRIAELYRRVTPQHGGPDRLYLTLRRSDDPLGEEVYSQAYECSDFSAFRLQWETPHQLKVAYGECDSGQWHTEGESAVQWSLPAWRDVSIEYEDTKYVAHALSPARQGE
jgi:hypothetical protein